MMSKEKQNLKQRRIQGLDQILKSWALTPLLGNKALYRDTWQVRKGNNVSAKQQEVLAWFETELGVKG